MPNPDHQRVEPFQSQTSPRGSDAAERLWFRLINPLMTLDGVMVADEVDLVGLLPA